MVNNPEARLSRVQLDFEDGYSMILVGSALRLWEQNMLQGQRLRLMMESVSNMVQANDKESDISKDRPKTLLDALLDEED